ncbi:porin family protein [Rhodocytophaga aerolata]|uniref:Porin family protein n=1 Tax=Rhodocytophaga aerolata TaxID=455078 RepID=A0ABT8RG55_9BACT|nr:porin family protein [Rhodocytophaga aerolata]MDO1451083.1 porin family protein [Rhodocytophaga aerolata]
MQKKNNLWQKLAFLNLLALLLFVAAPLQAQEDNPGPKFGIKGGANLSQLYINQPNVEDENMKIGYHFGLFGKIPVTDFLAIQPELLYTNTGAKVTYGGSDLADLLGIEEGEVRFNLNYIQVPIALVANLGPVQLHGGPYISYLAGANVKDLKSADLNSNEITDLNADNFNRMDYGLVGGIGVDINKFMIGARYNYGLRKVGDSGIAGTLTNDSRNSVAQLYIGFGF